MEEGLSSFEDRPFGAPIDMVIDLPAPVSVNRSRKIDWKGHQRVKAWCEMADRFLLVAKSNKVVRFEKLPRYEVLITLSEDHVKIDADNGVKLLVDYLRHRDIVANDGPKNLRRFSVAWGHAPAGVRIIVRACE